MIYISCVPVLLYLFTTVVDAGYITESRSDNLATTQLNDDDAECTLKYAFMLLLPLTLFLFLAHSVNI